MDLATIRPTQPDPVWAAVATGMYPAKNGVRSAGALLRAATIAGDRSAARSLLLARARAPRACCAASRIRRRRWQARPLWEHPRRRRHQRVGIVRWPLTLSGAAGRRLHRQRSLSPAASGRCASSTAVRPIRREIAAGDPQSCTAAAGSEADRRGLPRRAALRRRRPRRPRRDGRGSTAARCASCGREGRCSFAALRYQGLDTVGHFYLRYAQPRAFGGSHRARSADATRRCVDRYYAYIDGEIGAAIAALAPGDLLLVVSGFGMQRLHPVKQSPARLLGDPDMQRHARERARRLPAGLRLRRPARPQAARLDRRRHADHPLFPRPADRPRHGRLRARRSLHPRVHRGAADRLHSVVQLRVSQLPVPAVNSQGARLPGMRALAVELGVGSAIIVRLFNATL